MSNYFILTVVDTKKLNNKVFRFQPDIYSGNEAFFEIAKQENRIIGELDVLYNHTFEDSFLRTAHEEGLHNYERLLNVTPKSTDTLEMRRSRLQSMMLFLPPFTRILLLEKLNELCGEGNYEMVIIPEEYHVRIKISLEKAGLFNDVKALLEEILPANLIIEVLIMFNAWDMFLPYTWQQLKDTKTWLQVKEEILT